MKTFFCRHSSALDIDLNTHQFLWENNYLAIHYPTSKSGWDDEEDCQSLNPKDYSGSALKGMNALQNLSRDGGFVFCVYESQNQYKIGKIEPNTPIEILFGKWGNKNGLEGRKAALKALKINDFQVLSPAEALSLTSVQPRQGTICVWSKVETRVKNLVQNINESVTLSDLTPDLQEVLCQEFLRMGLDPLLPKLEALLAPIGRTMKDVDIFGLSKEGKTILAQVSYSWEPAWKIDRLKKYDQDHQTDLILFCQTDQPKMLSGVRIYPLNKAFELFQKSEIGRKWIGMIK
ncbi:hypothetical protein [Algoriphagus mannitolivorans]|uniref:hypothetical protein n=1 Tax=Algoriphagus mannitolivorans TaxID=226504 RepID=UPI00047DF6FF|nr:hypothetical protein [Algoriphagus mannitolivorans]